MNVVTNADYGSGLLTVAEVAQRLRCSEPTVRRRIREGQIPAVKLGEGRSARRQDARMNLSGGSTEETDHASLQANQRRATAGQA